MQAQSLICTKLNYNITYNSKFFCFGFSLFLRTIEPICLHRQLHTTGNLSFKGKIDLEIPK